MEKMNETTAVQKQYKNANNLNTRISIHHKYSTNKQSYGDWIYENYSFSSGFKVLELGCGTGEMWIQKASELPEGTSLLLTDFSAGMLETRRISPTIRTSSTPLSISRVFRTQTTVLMRSSRI